MFYGCRRVLVEPKGEMIRLLFVVCFRQTKLSVCSDPQEGSVAQCVELAVHEEEAGDEFHVIRMSHWCGCVRSCGSRCHIKPDRVVVVKKSSFICFGH